MRDFNSTQFTEAQKLLDVHDEFVFEQRTLIVNCPMEDLIISTERGRKKDKLFHP